MHVSASAPKVINNYSSEVKLLFSNIIICMTLVVDITDGHAHSSNLLLGIAQYSNSTHGFRVSYNNTRLHRRCCWQNEEGKLSENNQLICDQI